MVETRDIVEVVGPVRRLLRGSLVFVGRETSAGGLTPHRPSLVQDVPVLLDGVGSGELASHADDGDGIWGHVLRQCHIGQFTRFKEGCKRRRSC